MDETQVGSGAGRSRADRGSVGGKSRDGRLGQGWITRWSRTDRMMMIDQGWTDVRKGRYDGECTKVDTMVICTRAVRGTADEEEYSE